MKVIRIMSFVLVLIVLCIPARARASTSVAFSLDFHDALAPYGTWVHISACSNCWRPAVAGFVPYTNGHWVYTSYGPTWEGYEPWAWAPYHYGHWVFTAQYGWIWAPGYEWSPGRVAWCYGDDYIGWSPLVGASVVDTNLWIMVHRSNFGYRNYAPVRIQRDTVRTLFARRAVRVTSAPLQRTQMERIVRHSIPVQRVRERTIEVNHHRARLIVTQDREATVVRHLSEVSAKRKAAAPVRISHTSTESHRSTTIHRSSSHSNESRKPTTIHQSSSSHSNAPHRATPVQHSSSSHSTVKKTTSSHEQSGHGSQIRVESKEAQSHGKIKEKSGKKTAVTKKAVAKKKPTHGSSGPHTHKNH